MTRARTPSPTSARPRLTLRYTDARRLQTLHTIDVGGGDDYMLDVIGVPDDASYEWLLRCKDEVIRHSDCAYGIPAIALRDGLIDYYGLPDQPPPVRTLA